ncbi:MAG: glycosyltransferase family 39 protein [SAR324 cluster bacterium]|uniref:Glycosyltransferase family 39 protein n=1 Tax=SAR324 cluster bacterium TaxID=2024889 RepID=A0A7X9IKS2_9DELT|nr:glycosyltransferase family 39 protein [SAR324 cluster bacterium]
MFRAGDIRKSLTSSVFLHLALILIVFSYVFYRILELELGKVGRLGFAMDDAWIHMAVARNFLEGKGWGVVPGRALSVSTSPTWTLLVAFFYFIFRDPVTAILTLSFLCMVGACILCYFLVHELTENALLGLFACLALIFSPVVLWGMASGMELPLVLCVLFGTFYLYYSADADSKVRLYVVPLALAISAITRPELFVLIPLALADTFRTLYLKASVERIFAFRRIVIQSLIILVALSPYLLFNKLNGGYLFPTTYYAKTLIRGVGITAALKSGDSDAIFEALIKNPMEQTQDVVDLFLNNNMVLFFLIMIGFFGFCRATGRTAARRGVLIVAAMLVLPYAMGVSAPSRAMSNHADRYFIIFPAIGVVLASVGVDLLYRLGRQRIVVALCVLLVLIAPWWTTYETIKLVISDVHSTEKMYRPIAEWINENLKPETVLAVNDIGVIAYFSKRDLIDVMGLASPEIWPAIMRSPGGRINFENMKKYLRERKVEYLLLSPLYYPALTNDTNTFEPIKRWKEKYPHGRMISPQIMYKCHWPEP